MFRIALSLCLVLLIAPVAAQQARAQVQGKNDFRSIAPRDWTLLPYGTSNERRFVSPNRDAWLSLYSTRADGPVADHLRDWGVRPSDRVTYAKRGRDWAVVSGYTADDRIFYRRTMLACGGRKWHDLVFEYPARDKRAMDGFVTRASYALGAYQSMGCAR